MDEELSLRQILADIGLSEEETEAFFRYEEYHNVCAQLKILAGRRKALLAQVHEDERKLSCLDYLACKLRKECRK